MRIWGVVALAFLLTACGGGGGGGDDSDTTAPTLTLLGDNPLLVDVNTTYTDPGATATDNKDGDITSNIVVAGDTVNIAVAGSYTVTYNVSDAAGNAADQLTRTVTVRIDTETPPGEVPPVLALLGDNPLVIEVGGSYTDPGATAYRGDECSSFVPFTARTLLFFTFKAL